MDKSLAMLYSIFDTDFKQTKRFFEGRPVWWDRRILAGDRYEEGFWHLITKTDQSTNERLLDPRRAERLPWCGPTISNSADQAIKVWDFQESGGRLRTYVWLEERDYVIILEKRQQRLGEIAFLITAFHVDGDSRRRNLKAKYEKRVV
ncbi:MAG: hypothetical protein ACREOI_20625 [bacterium]